MRYDGGLYLGGSNGDDKGKVNSGSIFKIEPMGFANRLHVRYISFSESVKGGIANSQGENGRGAIIGREVKSSFKSTSFSSL